MNSSIQRQQQYRSAVADIRRMLASRRANEAAAACLALAEASTEPVEPLLLLAKARQQQGHFEDMLQLTELALSRDAGHRGAQLQYAEACIFCGEHSKALAQLALLEQDAYNEPKLLQHVAEFYAHSGKHRRAHRCYLRAVELLPKDPGALYNLASSYVAVGDIALAEQTYSQVIALNPQDYDAWQNRSTLRKQTPDNNHIDALTKALDSLPEDDPGAVPLNYALAREYEDLGQYPRSFQALQRGASSRRRKMAYNVQNDVQIMSRITQLLDRRYAEQAPVTDPKPGPIFVLGLPRSGTTLVDRIISSHSQVESLGEINDFALTLTRLGQSVDKNRLLEASLNIDPKKLGSAYVESARHYGTATLFFIDKTPANFLYLGLIARALPNVPVVHVHRHPLDSCLAMYRTLFRMGYPFSYDLADLADYYIAYHRLMKHWRNLYPGLVLDVCYEELVAEQEAVTRRIISHCGLAFESACLQFEQNRSPVATASAAQVRQPMYNDAVARWRRYENELQPLIERLQEAGIAL